MYLLPIVDRLLWRGICERRDCLDALSIDNPCFFAETTHSDIMYAAAIGGSFIIFFSNKHRRYFIFTRVAFFIRHYSRRRSTHHAVACAKSDIRKT